MNISKRSFLKTTLTATGSLLVFATTGPLSFADEKKANPMPFIEMAANGDITFISSRSDMGQGSVTSLAQILLDEMDADWDKLVSVKETEADHRSIYQEGLSTIGAISTFIGWFNHREAGACLREGFKVAAAELWQVDKETLITEKSTVIDPATGNIYQYHELYESLSNIYLPKVPDYKTREQSTLVGKPLAQLRSKDRVTGVAQYGIDVKFPGLKVAMVERCPTFGGKVSSFDASDCLKIKGVLAVVEIHSGIAVVADGFWAAKKGREALQISWDYGELQNLSSDMISEQLRNHLDEPPVDANSEPGDAITVLSKEGGKKITGEFSFPLVAHATMEPMNATAWVTDKKCEIWAPTQSKLDARDQVAEFLERKNEEVILHRTLCGGGFGRRAQEDFILEAVDTSMKSGYPVKLIWSREDDIRHDYFRSCSAMRIVGKMDDEGKLVAWKSALSFIDTSPYHFSPGDRGTKDGRFVGMAGIEPAYKIPNRHLGFNMLDLPITVGILRGISHGYTNFANEMMIERLAKLADRDPLELRAELLVENERAHIVIQELIKINRDNPTPDGMTRGYAFAFEGEPGVPYQYYSGHMADVRKLEDGTIKVHKMWVVADHGRVINPRSFKRQIHSSIIFALSMMRSGVITLKNGAVEQGNFDDYPVSLIGEGAEYVDIKLLDSDAHPMGCGEKMQAGLQPAIASAVEKLTGEEVNGIPIKNLA